MSNKKTLFLDRDGVINVRTPDAYVERWEEFIFEHGALDALKLLRPKFDYLIVVTNQAGIGRGFYSQDTLLEIHEKMLQLIENEANIVIDAVYHCPHRKEEKCDCRKPNIGMATEAKQDFRDIDFQHAMIVGDSISDMEFGFRLGLKTILIEGKTEELAAAQTLNVTARFGSLLEFAQGIETIIG